MTTAADFNTNALYPGGEGKCKVGTADLYPSDPWKVNVSMADLHKWMWNLEDWDVSCKIYWEIFDSTSTDSESAGFELSGQFHFLEAQTTNTLWARVHHTPPNARVCGGYFESEFPPGTTETWDSTNPTYSSSTGPLLLPTFWHESLHDDYATYSLNLEDGSSNIVGDVSFDQAITEGQGGTLSENDADHEVVFSPYYVRLLGDGTADVYFDFYYRGIAFFYGASVTIFDNEEDATDEFGIGETVTTSINVFGSSLTAYALVFAPYVDPGGVLNTFSCTLSITVTTAFTY